MYTLPVVLFIRGMYPSFPTFWWIKQRFYSISISLFSSCLFEDGKKISLVVIEMVHSAPGMSFVVCAGVSGSCTFVLESATNSRVFDGGMVGEGGAEALMDRRCDPSGVDGVIPEIWQTGIIIVGRWCPESRSVSSFHPCREIRIFTRPLQKHSCASSFLRSLVLSFFCKPPPFFSPLPLSEVLINSQPPQEVWDLSLHFVIGLGFAGPL